MRSRGTRTAASSAAATALEIAIQLELELEFLEISAAEIRRQGPQSGCERAERAAEIGTEIAEIGLEIAAEIGGEIAEIGGEIAEIGGEIAEISVEITEIAEIAVEIGGETAEVLDRSADGRSRRRQRRVEVVLALVRLNCDNAPRITSHSRHGPKPRMCYAAMLLCMHVSGVFPRPECS